jgi:hypothetical protein
MKTIYRINWSTKAIETAKLLDENHLCDGATRETWLCRDSSGQKFVTSKGTWHFSEKAAWEEYSYDLENSLPLMLEQIEKAQKEYSDQQNELTRAKQKVKELELAK